MPYDVTAVDPTPNPHALKITLTPSPGPTPRSYRAPDAAHAADDPLALALFALPGVTGLLIHTTFITVTKSPETPWKKLRPLLLHTLQHAPT